MDEAEITRALKDDQLADLELGHRARELKDAARRLSAERLAQKRARWDQGVRERRAPWPYDDRYVFAVLEPRELARFRALAHGAKALSELLAVDAAAAGAELALGEPEPHLAGSTRSELEALLIETCRSLVEIADQPLDDCLRGRA